MGGMSSVVKVRKEQPAGDYKDPGWFKHPPGTVDYEFTGALPHPARPKAETEVMVRKPGAGSSQHKEH